MTTSKAEIDDIRVVAKPAYHGVVARAAVERIDARAADQKIVTKLAEAACRCQSRR